MTPDKYMIVAVSVDLRDVARLGRAFQWALGEECPRCKHKTWGHGWVRRWFEGLTYAVLVPRRRCPHCGCVVTLRPSSHHRRFQTSTERMGEVLRHRLSRRCWPHADLRQRFGHWLRRFHGWLRFNYPSADQISALRQWLELRFPFR